MAEKIVTKNLESGIYTLGLDTNEQNSLTLDNFRELFKALETLETSQDVRVLIIHSLQPKVFCQGLNLQELANNAEEEVLEFVKYFFGILKKIYLFPQPVVCAMNGHSMGYGCMIALLSDYRFMSPKSRIGLPEVKLGIRVPIFIARALQDLIGVRYANQHILEGNAYKAEQAMQIGMIDAVIAQEEVFSHSISFARKFLKNSRTGMLESKKAMRMTMQIEDILAVDYEKTLESIASADAKEGIAAAIEMRKPSFA
ncbi:MAG: enoyl-CoA hydratase/isomerase family protein [Spirochaetota bacterium]